MRLDFDCSGRDLPLFPLECRNLKSFPLSPPPPSYSNPFSNVAFNLAGCLYSALIERGDTWHDYKCVEETKIEPLSIGEFLIHCLQSIVF